jgi:SecD/SecF fusion protein
MVQSFDSGFQRALATVVDANLTTLIVAVILFYMGTGPVRGFAVTLGIGIITTVFTAFTLTRWLVAIWLRRRSARRSSRRGWFTTCRWSRNCLHEVSQPRLPVLGALSLLVAGTFLVKDFNYGIDFLGGSMIEVQAKDQAADPADVRERLSQLEHR